MDGKATLTIITGPMFSGKTETLIAKIKEAQSAGLVTKVFKPAMDTRYATDAIVTHSKDSISAQAIAQSQDILKHIEGVQVIGIDEAQFFDEELPVVCTALLEQGVEVIAGGLDKDYRALPFGIMPQLIEMAAETIYLTAVCSGCGKEATYTYRKSSEKATFLLGEQEIYEARCEDCFKKK